jgi:proline iminopeptidase
MFTEKNPDKVTALVLVSSPVSYQQTFRSIIKNCKKNYTTENKQDQLGYIYMLEKMDTTDLMYASYCFLHAMNAGLYTTNQPAENSKEILKNVSQSPDARYIRDMTKPPVQGFYKSEHYTTLNLTGKLTAIKKQVPIAAIYGTDDGLFDETQLAMIKSITGETRFAIIQNASHSIFIDQQDKFIEALKIVTK